jgi:hypothetical protein
MTREDEILRGIGDIKEKMGTVLERTEGHAKDITELFTRVNSHTVDIAQAKVVSKAMGALWGACVAGGAVVLDHLFKVWH